MRGCFFWGQTTIVLLQPSRASWRAGMQKSRLFAMQRRPNSPLVMAQPSPMTKVSQEQLGAQKNAISEAFDKLISQQNKQPVAARRPLQIIHHEDDIGHPADEAGPGPGQWGNYDFDYSDEELIQEI